jgi:tetratricopeptide (TPR) repeat protein
MFKKLQIRFIFVTSFFLFSLYQTNAQTERSKRFLDSLINVFQKEKTDSAKGFVALKIAEKKMGAAQNTGNWDEAIEWASKGVYYSKKGNFKYGIRRCNWMLGMSWKFKGNYPEAIGYFTEMSKAAIQENLPKAVLTSYNWIGDCYLQLGNQVDFKNR